MNDDIYFGEYVVDGAIDVAFLVIFFFARVNVHFAHDGLNVTILNSNKIVLFSNNVSIGFVFMD
jgi:hypothetical protein